MYHVTISSINNTRWRISPCL